MNYVTYSFHHQIIVKFSVVINIIIDRQCAQEDQYIHRHCEITKNIRVALLLYPGMELALSECKQVQMEHTVYICPLQGGDGFGNLPR